MLRCFAGYPVIYRLIRSLSSVNVYSTVVQLHNDLMLRLTSEGAKEDWDEDLSICSNLDHVDRGQGIGGILKNLLQVLQG